MYFTDNIVNSTNVVKLCYSTDVYVCMLSYTGHYDIQISFLLVLFVFVQVKASPGSFLIVASCLFYCLFFHLLFLVFRHKLTTRSLHLCQSCDDSWAGWCGQVL